MCIESKPSLQELAAQRTAIEALESHARRVTIPDTYLVPDPNAQLKAEIETLKLKVERAKLKRELSSYDR